MTENDLHYREDQHIVGLLGDLKEICDRLLGERRYRDGLARQMLAETRDWSVEQRDQIIEARS